MHSCIYAQKNVFMDKGIIINHHHQNKAQIGILEKKILKPILVLENKKYQSNIHKFQILLF